MHVSVYIVYFKKSDLFLNQRIKAKEPRKDLRIWQKARAGKPSVALCPALIIWRKQEVPQLPPDLGQGMETDPYPQAGQPEPEMEMCLKVRAGFLWRGPKP